MAGREALVENPESASVVAHRGCNSRGISGELAFVLDSASELFPGCSNLTCAQLQRTYVSQDDLRIEPVTQADGPVNVDGFAISRQRLLEPVGGGQADGQ